jgi:hypothetical protein
MKKILLALCLASVPLAGCQTLAGVAVATDLATKPVCAGHVADEKAWYAVEAAYNVPAQAYLAANAHGLLTPSLKATLKPKLQAMNQVRLAAKAAYQACDAASLTTKLAALTQLRDQVMPLIPKA